ncbi:MAG: hypothetical protein M1820_006014 [Bogoriella megaspora]|nr:MAG: hypothetical protein M1820_006014 [Bogoriella megaspora]
MVSTRGANRKRSSRVEEHEAAPTSKRRAPKRVRFATKTDSSSNQPVRKGPLRTSGDAASSDDEISTPIRRTRRRARSSAEKPSAESIVATRPSNEKTKNSKVQRTTQRERTAGARNQRLDAPDWTPITPEELGQVGLASIYGMEPLSAKKRTEEGRPDGNTDENTAPKSTTENEIESLFTALITLIRRFVEDQFAFAAFGSEDQRGPLCALMNNINNTPGLISASEESELVNYITCHASGGPGLYEDWQIMLWDPQARLALLCSIIGRALQEHVFSELLFGASEDQKARLQRQEARLATRDGFIRTEARAKLINKWLHVGEASGPPKLKSSIADVTLKIYALIFPLLILNPNLAGLARLAQSYGLIPAHDDEGTLLEARQAVQHKIISGLRNIVEKAVKLAITIRVTEDIIFHFRPSYKNTLYEYESMESWDGEFISRGDPQYPSNHLRKAYRRAHWEDEPIVQIVVFPGVTMFKRGAPPGIEEVETDELKFKEKGIRVKRLRKSLVYLRWGSERSVPPKKDDGYIELLDAFAMARGKELEGVFQPVTKNTLEKELAEGAAEKETKRNRAAKEARVNRGESSVAGLLTPNSGGKQSGGGWRIWPFG